MSRISAETDDTTNQDPAGVVSCNPEPAESSCGDVASIVQTVVHAGTGGPTSGTLVMYLTHLDLGDERNGGYYHTDVSIPDVDLADGPLQVDLDMCAGGEMWSMEWGDYNIVAVLDQDGDNAPAGFDSKHTPDEGEPSARVSPVKLTAGRDAVCFDDVVLDCLDGRSCAAY